MEHLVGVRHKATPCRDHPQLSHKTVERDLLLVYGGESEGEAFLLALACVKAPG